MSSNTQNYVLEGFLQNTIELARLLRVNCELLSHTIDSAKNCEVLYDEVVNWAMASGADPKSADVDSIDDFLDEHFPTHP